MKLITEYLFHISNSFPAAFSGPVYYKNGYIYYAYGMGRELFCRKIAADGTSEELSYRIPDEKKAGLPYSWRLFTYQDSTVLSCGSRAHDLFPDYVECRIFLNLDDEMHEIEIPAEIADRYICAHCIDETAAVSLSDCIMRYKNSRSCQCFDFEGNLLWTEKHKGYRYTDFEEKNGCVIFGTAGHGGGLYCYRKSDGACLCAVDTKGTASYTWYQDHIISRGRGGELLFIDPYNGEVTHSCSFKGRFNDESAFFVDGSYLCAVGFEEKTNSPCVYLFDLAEL